MPRIQAPTLAEHRQRQRRALLNAARALLAETGEAPTLAAIGERAGLARTSVYQYFSSPGEMLTAVIEEVFPEWADQVRRQVETATTPGERVWAYVCANLELFASSERAVANALRKVVAPDVLKEPMETFHAELQVPLVAALIDHGEPYPQLMAETIDSAILRVSRSLEDAPDNQTLGKAAAVAFLHRLLQGYLRLPPT